MNSSITEPASTLRYSVGANDMHWSQSRSHNMTRRMCRMEAWRAAREMCIHGQHSYMNTSKYISRYGLRRVAECLDTQSHTH